jgi:pimeloyl-ACP methyl ester carboxylesterase
MAQPIDSLEALTINGVKQWILIQSRDTTQPILLVLHGGPGYAMLPLLRGCNPALEDDFVVVNWDQRGAGRSYSRRVPEDSMTLKQFLADLQALTLQLLKRFRRRKIYLLGHSFGSMLGLSAAKSHPENYFAYIGVGQVIGPIVNEIAMYEWTLQEAKRQGNVRAGKELKQIGHPDRQGRYPNEGPDGADPYETAAGWMRYFGGDLHRKHGSAEIDDWLLAQPAYRGNWGTRWEEGLVFSRTIFNDDAAWQLDFRKSVPSVDIPVFFLHGHHDQDTPWPLVQQYVPTLKAPRKELIWFEKSAHFPFYEQGKEFHQKMVKVVKASTYPRS